ncbi:MAG TPA: hypothetical protein VF152_11305 [Acidimicrobiia bacterium]
MARHLGGVAVLAAGAIVALLVLGQAVSGWADARGLLTALFFAFLVAAFSLLAVAVVDSEHGVEQLSASPRWSLRAAVKRRVRRLATFIGIHVARAARATRAGTVRLAAWLRASLTRERLAHASRTTLLELGIPLPAEADQLPDEGLDAMPTLRRDWPSGAGAEHQRERQVRLARAALVRARHRVLVAVSGAPTRRAGVREIAAPPPPVSAGERHRRTAQRR